MSVYFESNDLMRLIWRRVSNCPPHHECQSSIFSAGNLNCYNYYTEESPRRQWKSDRLTLLTESNPSRPFGPQRDTYSVRNLGNFGNLKNPWITSLKVTSSNLVDFLKNLDVDLQILINLTRSGKTLMAFENLHCFFLAMGGSAVSSQWCPLLPWGYENAPNNPFLCLKWTKA